MENAPAVARPAVEPGIREYRGRIWRKEENMSVSRSGWNAHEYIDRYDAGEVRVPDRDRIGSIIVMALACICTGAVLIGIVRDTL